MGFAGYAANFISRSICTGWACCACDIAVIAIARDLGLQQSARSLRDLLRKSGMMATEKGQHAVHLPDLDWARTRAWIPSASGSLAGYADIFLDDQLAEEDIQGLMRTLGDVVDPQSGERLFVEMHRE